MVPVLLFRLEDVICYNKSFLRMFRSSKPLFDFDGSMQSKIQSCALITVHLENTSGYIRNQGVFEAPLRLCVHPYDIIILLKKEE